VGADVSGFNLVDDPWVTVRTAEGGRAASLREVLTGPERFIALDAGEVDEHFALLRLLTTIVNRALDGPATADEWAHIAYGGGYDVAAIQAYLDRWRRRFELFDPERPFLQYPELAGRKNAPTLAVLLPSISSGNAVTLFSHACERDGLALTPAAAARGLVHVVLNGRGTLKGGEYGVLGARVAVLGQDLRETLIGNLPRYLGANDDGIPVWERDRPRALPTAPRTPTEVPRGLLDFATWQWRAVLLRPPVDGLVRSCVYGHGPRPAGEEPTDPARWYDVPTPAERAKDPALPLRRDHRLRADRDVWREADALLAALARKDVPGILIWNVDHREPGEFDVLVGGPIVELKGSWVLTGMRSAVLPVPKALLRDERLRGRVSEAIESAGGAARALWGAVHLLARELARPAPNRDPGKRRSKDLATTFRPEVQFWAALTAAFEALLRDIADPGALIAWNDRVRAEARRSLGEVVSGLAPSARALRAAVSAERHLSLRLDPHRELSPPATQPSGAPA
jgi:CRISPR system Cascade subunit CasA